jgi:hypothetical protein
MRYAPNKGLAARGAGRTGGRAIGAFCWVRFLWSLTLDDLGVQGFANIVRDVGHPGDGPGAGRIRDCRMGDARIRQPEQ